MKKVPQDPCDRQTKPHTLYGKVIVSLPRDKDEHYIQHKPDYWSIKLKKELFKRTNYKQLKKHLNILETELKPRKKFIMPFESSILRRI